MTHITPQRMREIEAYQNASTHKPATEQNASPQLTPEHTTEHFNEDLFDVGSLDSTISIGDA